jgi:ribosome-associated heat shock protein Hsp15
VRIDRLLCNLRFLRTRSLAAELVRAGHLRRNGTRVTRPSQEVAVGDVLTIPLGTVVRLVEVLALPEKRGPAREAQACYRALDRSAETELGEAQDINIQGDAHP